uniref:GRAM domain containing 1A n=1 Tax=Ursus americanus TaxID=9643 RepID=A0A452R4G1_URSAM
LFDSPQTYTTPHSGRSTPSSSPSLRKRLQLLPSSRPPPEPEPGTMVEKGSDSSSEKGGVPGTPSTQSLGGRNFIRNSKKMQSWYSMLSPTYKQRNEDFRKLFSKLPEAERLIVEGPSSGQPQGPLRLRWKLYVHTQPPTPALVFPQSQILMANVGMRGPSGWLGGETELD